jgi:hypothetical protein
MQTRISINMSLELPRSKTRSINVSILCKSQCYSTAKNKGDQKKKKYRYITEVGATELRGCTSARQRNRGKRWEKEIIEETEGGKMKRNKIIKKHLRKQEEEQQ